jgi:hypothetical protein
MNSIYFDSPIDDDKRRNEVYKGQLFVYSPTPATLAFIEFAREMIQDAFAGFDPVTAQYHMKVEDYAAILSKLKPAFIHHLRSKEHIRSILSDRGCDPELTYFDVPRMRSSTSDEFLTSGIAYAFHPHRDTWYSAPMCQINWWLPIYEVEPGNVMAFHPQYYSNPVKNSSNKYNYQEWNETSRYDAANHIKSDTRVQPRSEENIALDPQLRIVTAPGGMVVFSAAHMHSSVPNSTGKTRFSIDFRTVHLGDLKEMGGATNVDSECTGTTMYDYLQASTFNHIRDDIVSKYLEGNIATLISAKQT